MNAKGSVARATCILFLIALFSCCALLSAALSASVLRGVTVRGEASYETRTSLLYISQKLRACEGQESVRVERFGDSDALVLTSETDGTAYETWIYTSGGGLYEVTAKPGAALSAAAGQPITAVDELRVEETARGLYDVRVGFGGGSAGVLVAVQASGEAAR